MPSIGEAFQRSTKEKEQAEECTFIIEPFLSCPYVNFFFEKLRIKISRWILGKTFVFFITL